MSRYIDADRLQSQLQRKKAPVAQKRYTEGFNDALMRFKSMIQSEPAIDIETMDNWVNVEDRLPKTDGKNTHVFDVLCYVPKRKGVVQHGIYIGKLAKVKEGDGTGNFFNMPTPSSEWTLWDWSYYEKPIVTHWKPLPQPPKMNKD